MVYEGHKFSFRVYPVTGHQKTTEPLKEHGEEKLNGIKNYLEVLLRSLVSYFSFHLTFHPFGAP